MTFMFYEVITTKLESQETTKDLKYGRIAKQIPKLKGNRTTDGQTSLIHKPELLCNLTKNW